MAVDKDLFLYDLAVVAIMRNETPYIEEWLNYHIAAGVNHFYIYDDSDDNFREVIQPYVDAGIVDYIFFPGTSPQFPAYDDALKRYKFSCRYLSFIDADEFIFPQSDKSIVEVADEILAGTPNAGGLAIVWHCFGSSGNEKADYSRGVLERFLYRAAPEFNLNVIKNIVNPRRLDYFDCPHKMNYFEDYFSIDETGTPIFTLKSETAPDKKIVVNHYFTKSLEEYLNKIGKGDCVYTVQPRSREKFYKADHNEIYDDGILKYLQTRNYNRGGVTDSINYRKCYNALLRNLSPIFSNDASQEFFVGKLETFLVCRRLAESFRGKIFDERSGKIFENAALQAIHRSLAAQVTFSELELLLSEMPQLLKLDYPVVQEILWSCQNILPQMLKVLRSDVRNYNWKLWNKYERLRYTLELLKTLDSRPAPKYNQR